MFYKVVYMNCTMIKPIHFIQMKCVSQETGTSVSHCIHFGKPRQIDRSRFRFNDRNLPATEFPLQCRASIGTRPWYIDPASCWNFGKSSGLFIETRSQDENYFVVNCLGKARKFLFSRNLISVAASLDDRSALSLAFIIHHEAHRLL
jgi:hypothetical protein